MDEGMWTTPKRLWLDEHGKVTGTARDGVEQIAGPSERVSLTVADAKRLGLTGRALKQEPDAEPEPEPEPNEEATP